MAPSPTPIGNGAGTHKTYENPMCYSYPQFEYTSFQKDFQV